MNRYVLLNRRKCIFCYAENKKGQWQQGMLFIYGLCKMVEIAGKHSLDTIDERRKVCEKKCGIKKTSIALIRLCVQKNKPELVVKCGYRSIYRMRKNDNAELIL